MIACSLHFNNINYVQHTPRHLTVVPSTSTSTLLRKNDADSNCLV